MTTTMAPPSRQQVQSQARPDIERQRSNAEQQARQTLDREAVSAIEETRNALKAIADGRTDEAVKAIERATGKIDVLLSRNPDTALLPIDASARIIDTAPDDVGVIRELADAVDAATFLRDFPLARVLLAAMISEIRLSTVHLPLGTYPLALREAARLLDQKHPEEARGILEFALSTLVVIDRIIPLPLVIAEIAVAGAESIRQQDRDTALGLLAVARNELERSMELGYMGRDEEYTALSRSISDLEKQLRGNENSDSAFAKLRERLSNFFRRLSVSPKSSKDRPSAPGRQSTQSPGARSQQTHPGQQAAQGGERQDQKGSQAPSQQRDTGSAPKPA